MSAGSSWSRGVTRVAYALAGSRGMLSILALHRVRPRRDELFPEEIDSEQFDRLAAHLARSHQVLPLGEAVDRLAAGTLPARAVTITFDDGYADNATHALPILMRHGLRATFFVATGFLDGGLMWNDCVIESLHRCRAPSVDLDAFGLGRLPLDSLADRRKAIETVLPRVKYMTLSERERALAELGRACAHPVLPTDLMMSSSQVGELARAGMEIGGHTVRHPILACEELSTVEREIADGRARLRELSQTEVDTFAYPNGVPDKDYRSEHVDVLRRLKFRCAVTTSRGIAQAGLDRHQLPRFTPWDREPWRWSLRLLAARRSAVQVAGRPVLAGAAAAATDGNH